ncbi:MAG: hypothetical protein KF795_17850 [Labilithrix sp.]|nr:hypothetical protein [Labilithrix sp.]
MSHGPTDSASPLTLAEVLPTVIARLGHPPACSGCDAEQLVELDAFTLYCARCDLRVGVNDLVKKLRVFKPLPRRPHASQPALESNVAPVIPLRPEDDGRALIRVTEDICEVVDVGVGALRTDLEVYQRSGALVHVVRIAESESDAAKLLGSPQIRTMAHATLRERLAKVARWVKYDGRSGGLKPCVPPNDVVNALAERGQWKGIRPLVGIIEAPSLRPDGSVIQSEGYDPATGFHLLGAGAFPPIADRPTHEDAKKALAELAEPLRDFPFASEPHRSATIAAILTLVARPAIMGAVPAFLFDASTRGSGKTLQADVVAIIATGREAAKAEYPATDEELAKALGAFALQGAALVAFDNVVRPFGGGPIDLCLTAGDAVQFRILGRSEAPALRWRALLLGTGNNIQLVGDTARRVIFSRLEPSEESPEDRSGFRIANLRAWVREHRHRLVVAALTLLRAWHVAGRPGVGTKSWGSFEAWAALVPPALVWAGAADPMAARPSGDAVVEPEKAALATLLEELPRLAGDGGISVRNIVQALYPSAKLPAGPPDGFENLREAVELLTNAPHGKTPSPARLGYVLRNARRRNIGGRCLDARVGHGNTLKWSVVAVHPPHHPHGAHAEALPGGDGGDGGIVSPYAKKLSDGESVVDSQGPRAERGLRHHHPHHDEGEVGLDMADGLLGDWGFE